VAGEVLAADYARMLGAAHLQTDLQRGSRGDHQSADVHEVPQQLPMARRRRRKWGESLNLNK